MSTLEANPARQRILNTKLLPIAALLLVLLALLFLAAPLSARPAELREPVILLPPAMARLALPDREPVINSSSVEWSEPRPRAGRMPAGLRSAAGRAR